MRRVETMGLGALLMVAVTATSPAQAQPAAAAPEGSTMTPAEALFREGNAFAAQQRWVEAEAKFRAAWALNPSYDITANLGQTEFRLGKYRDAAEHLEFAVRTWGVTGDLTPKERAKKRLDEVRKLVTSLRVKVSVAGAKVFVDGKEIGMSPIDHELFLEPGTRTITASVFGHDDAAQTVEAKKGEAIDVVLTPKLRRVTAHPDRGPSVTPSPVTVPSSMAGPRSGLLIGGIATTGIALGVGVVFAVMASNKTSDADAKATELSAAGGANACAAYQRRDDCEALHGLREDVSTFGTVAVWSFIGAGIVGVGTTVYAMTSPRRTSTGLRATPVIAARGAGISVTGAW